MKSISAIVGLGVVLASLETNPPVRVPYYASGEAAQIEAAERQWANAVKRRDVTAIDWIQAEEFQFTDPSGQIWSKSSGIDAIKAGDLEIDSFAIDELNVRLYDTAGVVSFRIVWNGRFRGIDISGPQRMTDVWIKRDGRWQCVASQATRIATAL